MNKNLIIIGIAILLVCVGLSGCNEEKEDSDKESVSIVWEGCARVVNSSGEPQEGIVVEFYFGKISFILFKGFGPPRAHRLFTSNLFNLYRPRTWIPIKLVHHG